ncbi:MAG TPA: hypothetical protein VF138_01560 [Caulobacteraceae bacterium]
MRRHLAAGLAAATLAVGASGCSTAVKTTPGLAALEAGDDARAYTLLQSENAAGTPGSAYGLGVMAMEGRGGATKDEVTGEGILVDAALAGDPRAVSYLAKYYGAAPLCAKDKELARHWRDIGILQRNLISGVVETNLALPGVQRMMAEIYAQPCEGRSPRPAAAAILSGWSRMPRSVTVYVP